MGGKLELIPSYRSLYSDDPKTNRHLYYDTVVRILDGESEDLGSRFSSV